MTIFANRYEIVCKLGEGGMGEVWLAHDKEMSDTLVALKFVRHVLSDDTRALADLRREVINAKKLTDRRIVRIYELMKHNDVYFITMEYVPGEDLNNRLGRYQAEGHVFSLDEVLALAGEICPAMDYAHEQKVLHLDLKPRNIMAVEGGGFKVMDFGIARSAHESMTRVTNAPGYALGYSPPEQISGGEIDRRTDVYSLAATFYDLLAGHPPFWRGDVYRQTLEKPVVPIEGLPAEINKVLLWGLAKSPEERPAKAGDLLNLLLGEGETVVYSETLKVQDVQLKTCPQCGSYVDVDDRVCNRCGSSLVKVIPEPSHQISEEIKLKKQQESVVLLGEKQTKVVGPGIKLVRIPGGTFQMGSNEGELDERPSHTVTVNSFYMGETEVTNDQFCAFLNATNPDEKTRKAWVMIRSDLKSGYRKKMWLATEILYEGSYCPVQGYENYPVRCISWDGARAFCEYYKLRFPTEEEREYAAGGPSHSKYPWGNEWAEGLCCHWGRWSKNENTPPTTEVKYYQANWYDLFDMAGNVWEWCGDWYDVYPGGRRTESMGSKNRVLRGGSWRSDDPYILRCTRRNRGCPSILYDFVGFRVAGN